jgi:uncharacterized protein
MGGRRWCWRESSPRKNAGPMSGGNTASWPELPRDAGWYKVFSSGRLLLRRCEFNSSFIFRARGLLGRRGLGPGEGILLSPCNSIHMLFMKFAIDAVFLDRRGIVLRLCEGLLPWHFSPIVWRSLSVLEMAPGTIATGDITLNARLTFDSLSGS